MCRALQAEQEEDVYSGMKALVYQGRGKSGYQDKPRPVIKAQTDAVVRVTNTTICGRDLNAMLGNPRSVTLGRVLGQEGTGIVEEIGASVRNFRRGDCVLISCLTSCGACGYCKNGLAALCMNGGLLLGNSIDGTCAEHVRVPFADHSLFAVPGAGDEKTDGPWIERFHGRFTHGVFDAACEASDAESVVLGGSVGMGAPLAVAQYYRTVIAPILSGRVDQRVAPRLGRRLYRQLLYYFSPAGTRS